MFTRRWKIRRTSRYSVYLRILKIRYIKFGNFDLYFQLVCRHHLKKVPASESKSLVNRYFIHQSLMHLHTIVCVYYYRNLIFGRSWACNEVLLTSWPCASTIHCQFFVPLNTVFLSSAVGPLEIWSPYCQYMSPAIPLVLIESFCHPVSCEHLSFAVTPYSSKRHGLLTATQAAAWSCIHLFPNSIVIPPRFG